MWHYSDVNGISNNKQPAAGATDSPRPNIIFILADDLGWADLPSYGNRFNKAPNLDRMAREGMRFSDAYAASPVCSPTRASIFSGQYPVRLGLNDWIPGHTRPFEEVLCPVNRTQYLPTEVVTIAGALRKVGYATALFGKWHLGGDAAHHPLKQGFDEANVGQGFFHVTFDPPRSDSEDKVMAERLTDFGIQFIERNKERPFFLVLSHWDVHCQFDAEQPLIDRSLAKPKIAGYPCNAVYAAMIAQMDRSIGRLLDKLDELGLARNTLVVFTSDNGGQISNDKYPGRRGERMEMIKESKREVYRDDPRLFIATSNSPLQGEKGNLYEGGVRVPLIVRWPGRIGPGTSSDAIVTSVDFYPTFLELAGTPPPAGQPLDGKSLLPALRGDAVDREREIFWHYPEYHHSAPASAVRKGHWKLVENLVTGRAELYHLGADIGETSDLSGVFPGKAGELLDDLKRWQKEVGAEFPKPNPAFDEARRYDWGEFVGSPD